MGTRAKLAKRALETDTPVMVQIQELIRGTTDAISLAQGVVYWQPPEQALEKVKGLVRHPSVSRYGADEGLPELRQALIDKLRRENNLNKSSIMVTAGANQAFVNLVLTLCDPGDSVVMFAPYYFNAYMSFQMTGVTNILVGPTDPKTLQPNTEWLKEILSQDPVPKMVTVVNPGNPSGAFIPKLLLLAFVNLVLTLCDPGDSVVMFAPYYFNAYMSFQMTGVTNILVGPTDPKTLQPNTEWLKEILSQDPVPKMVTVVNPGNPSGAFIPKLLLLKISELCKRAGAWFVVDNTYEYFMYDGLKHSCIEDDHVVNLFSFSKAYGMMGWRVGYIAYPEAVDGFAAQLLKVQDNIPICASIISQRLALHSLEVGPEWITERVQNLVKNRELLINALAPLGEDNVKGGQGAIFLWAKLPDKFSDDYEVVRWLVRKHRVVVVPGSACGGPGYVRISFGGSKEADCKVAADRLRQGLEELVRDGMVG